MKVLPLSAALALLFAAPAHAQWQGKLRLGGAGYDTNARRDSVKDGGSNGVRPLPDAVLSATASADGQYQGEGAQASGSYDLGGRKFLTLPSEDVLWAFALAREPLAIAAILLLALGALGGATVDRSRPWCRTSVSASFAV